MFRFAISHLWIKGIICCDGRNEKKACCYITKVVGLNNEIMLFSSTIVLRLLKMMFGVFKRPRRLIIKVCRHKCNLDRRLMIFLTSL